MVGEYMTETFTDQMKENVVNTLSVLHAKLGLDPELMKYHKEDPLTTHKTCPGNNVPVKADMIAAIEASLANLGVGEHTVTQDS